MTSTTFLLVVLSAAATISVIIAVWTFLDRRHRAGGADEPGESELLRRPPRARYPL